MTIIITYFLLMWFIGAILAIRVVKTGMFPTKDMAEALLAGGDTRFILIIWILFPLLMIPYSAYLIAYYVQYLVFEKKWRKSN